MLIIPLHNPAGPARPPLATLALIVINVLIFALYQAGDGRWIARAAELYESTRLLEREQPLYERYLAAERLPELAALRGDAQLFGPDVWVGAILYDRGFDAFVREHWAAAAAPPPGEWQQARAAFEHERNHVSAIRAGLTPADAIAKPWTFISSLFLHGDWGHLLGNMVFLLLFGFALERALGAALYVPMYLVSGVAAGLLYSVFNPQSYVPLVGASGAISGLMGMYVCLYRLRKIRFFYAIGFYFGEFRAPALLILPLWLAKEIYGQLFTDTNIAYLAHIGGLLAGAGLMLSARRASAAVSAAETAQTEKSELQAGIAKVQQAMSRLDYNRARFLVRGLCEQFPNNPWPWRIAVDISRLQPQLPAFHQDVRNLVARALDSGSDFGLWCDDVEEAGAVYNKLAPSGTALSGADYLKLAERCWQLGKREQAERWLGLARATESDNHAFKELVHNCASFYSSQGHTQSARRVLALAAPVAAGAVAATTRFPREMFD